MYQLSCSYWFRNGYSATMLLMSARKINKQEIDSREYFVEGSANMINHWCWVWLLPKIWFQHCITWGIRFSCGIPSILNWAVMTWRNSGSIFFFFQQYLWFTCGQEEDFLDRIQENFYSLEPFIHLLLVVVVNETFALSCCFVLWMGFLSAILHVSKLHLWRLEPFASPIQSKWHCTSRVQLQQLSNCRYYFRQFLCASFTFNTMHQYHLKQSTSYLSRSMPSFRWHSSNRTTTSSGRCNHLHFFSFDQTICLW